MKPFLKWAGGKQRLLNELVPRLPADYDARRHVEPFMGGAALFFDQMPGGARLNDKNRMLVGCYRRVRDYPYDVLRRLAALAVDHLTCPGHYYSARTAFNALTDDENDRAAALFLYLNRTCFNGLWRVNKKGEFNVPEGRYKKPKIYDEARILAAGVALAPVQISGVDFERVDYHQDDFVYFDPPYVPVSKTSSFTAYCAEDFGPLEQARLALLFQMLTDRGVPVMVSNADSPHVRLLFDGFRIERVTVRRSISAKKSSREEVGELIVRNY